MVFPEVRKNVVVPNAQVDGRPKQVITGSENPPVDGVRGDIGDLFLRNTGEVYQKTGAANTDWTLLGGSDGVSVESQGIAVPNGPFTTLNFTGAGVTASDAGGQQADITIPGGGGGGGLIYYTTVVGNSLQGDTALEVDFLDDGTGNGITAALAALPAAGGTILIRKGTYTLAAALTLNRSNVRLIGEGAGSTIIIGPTGANLMNIGDGITLRSNIQIEGITFSDGDATTPVNGGLVANGVADFTVAKCEFIGAASPLGWVGLAIADSGALGGEGHIITENYFSGGFGVLVAPASMTGLMAINGVSRVNISDNVFDGDGAAAYLGVNNGVDNVTIIGNSWTGNGGFCIDIVGSATNMMVSGNVMAKNDGAFFRASAAVADTIENLTITGNHIEANGNTTQLINIDGSGAVIENVTITGNGLVGGSGGVRLDNVTNATVTGNSIVDASGTGVDLVSPSTTAVVEGNSIVDCGTGISVATGNNLIQDNSIDGTGTGITVSGSDNIIIGNRGESTLTTDFSDSGARNHWDNNWFQLPSVTTTDAVATRLFDMPVQSTKSYIYEVEVTAMRTDAQPNQDHISEKAIFTVSVNSGNTPLISAVTVVFNDQTAGPAIAYTALPGPGTVFIDVTGVAAQTFVWSARIMWRNN